jgi:hypothetical protein
MRPNNRFAADGPLRGPPLNQSVRRHPGIALSISQGLVRLSVSEFPVQELSRGRTWRRGCASSSLPNTSV